MVSSLICRLDPIVIESYKTKVQLILESPTPKICAWISGALFIICLGAPGYPDTVNDSTGTPSHFAAASRSSNISTCNGE